MNQNKKSSRGKKAVAVTSRSKTSGRSTKVAEKSVKRYEYAGELLATMFNEGEIAVPLALQRRFCWEYARRCEFLESFADGMALDNIVLIDIASCLENAEVIGDTPSVEYFREYLDDPNNKYKYICLDGQNRIKTLEGVFHLGDTVSGNFTDADGESVLVQNKSFDSLPTRLQDRLKDRELLVVEMGALTKAQISQEFRRLNSGVSLNAAELRNCVLSPIAEVVRESSRKYETALSSAVSNKALLRMGDDELVAKTLMSLMYGPMSLNPAVAAKEMTAPVLMAWYRSGEDFLTLEDADEPDLYPKDALNEARAILGNIARAIAGPSKPPKVDKATWSALVAACQWVERNNYMVKDWEVFFEQVQTADQLLSAKSENNYAQKRNAEALKGRFDSVQRGDYYVRQRELFDRASARLARSAALGKAIKKRTKLFSLVKLPAKKKAA